MQLKRLLILLCLFGSLPAAAQDSARPGCSPPELTRQQDTLATYLDLDFAADMDLALANLFRLGALYQELALDCGYQPKAVQVEAMLDLTLRFASLDDMILAQSVGTDVDAILLEMEAIYGDPLHGQQLYNGLVPTLGGSPLGCAGCHENEAIAPLTAGAWTRVDEIRLKLSQFEDYSHRQYLVESVVLPEAYLAPGYDAVMPQFYGGQLTLEQLADLVAFLESQDQLLEAD